MADKLDPKEENQTAWQQRGTRLHPDDAKAWDELIESENLVGAEVIRLFCRRFIRDPKVREQFS